MTDTTEALVHMANQIADFFRAYPPDEAEHGVEQHIRDFWDPRMRRALAAYLGTGRPGLSPLALAGARRALLAPPPEPSPPNP